VSGSKQLPALLGVVEGSHLCHSYLAIHGQGARGAVRLRRLPGYQRFPLPLPLLFPLKSLLSSAPGDSRPAVP